MTWNVTSLVGKEPVAVCEFERYWLTIVGVISAHRLGFKTSLLERGCTLFLPVEERVGSLCL